MTTLTAPAKLTWTLEVTGRRADGLHELRSEMTTLELADRVEVDEGADGVEVVGLDAARVPEGPANLVARALALTGRRARVLVTKSIPVGGGLGGGSADAAAILRWAGGVDPAAALALGSDVPFCVVGGRALVEGVGERVTPLAYERREVTLFLADFGVDTAAVYLAYDELVARGWRASGANHLEEPARRVEPRLGALIDALRAELGPGVTLAGSGSTLFVAGAPLGPEPGVVGGARALVTVTRPAEAHPGA